MTVQAPVGPVEKQNDQDGAQDKKAADDWVGDEGFEVVLGKIIGLIKRDALPLEVGRLIAASP